MTTIDEPRLLPSDEDLDRVRFYQRRVAVLEDGLRQKDEVIADAVFCLHEAGDHENADRIERLAEPF